MVASKGRLKQCVGAAQTKKEKRGYHQLLERPFFFGSLVVLAALAALMWNKSTARQIADVSWSQDQALLEKIRIAFLNCEDGKNCCQFPRITLDPYVAAPSDAFHHGPMVLENLTSSWSARHVWERKPLLQRHGHTIVRATKGSSIAKNGARHIPKSAKAWPVAEGDHEMPLSELVSRWDSGQNDLLLFQSDFAESSGQCNHLDCLFAPVSFDQDVDIVYADVEFQLPTSLSRMDSLLASMGPSSQGVPMHSHGAAWLGLVHGRKLWLLYPPGGGFASTVLGMSGMELLRKFFPAQTSGPPLPMFCIQEPGEVVVLPHLWMHATLNIGDAIGVGGQIRGEKLAALLTCIEPLVKGNLVSSYAEGFLRCEGRE